MCNTDHFRWQMIGFDDFRFVRMKLMNSQWFASVVGGVGLVCFCIWGRTFSEGKISSE